MKFKHQGYSLSAVALRGIQNDTLRLSATFSRSKVIHHYKREDGAEAERTAERYGFAIQAFGLTWATYLDRRETPLVAKTWQAVIDSATEHVASIAWSLAE